MNGGASLVCSLNRIWKQKMTFPSPFLLFFPGNGNVSPEALRLGHREKGREERMCALVTQGFGARENGGRQRIFVYVYFRNCFVT